MYTHHDLEIPAQIAGPSPVERAPTITVHGTLRESAPSGGPDVSDLRSGADGLLEGLALRWTGARQNQVTALRFELIAREPLPPAWYLYQAHDGTGREVVDLR